MMNMFGHDNVKIKHQKKKQIKLKIERNTKMCTFISSLPKKSKSAGQRTAKKNLVMSLKPCPDANSYYRFRLLAFSSDSKNDRDDPHIIRWVHQVWKRDPEKNFPILEDEVICPVTPYVHVDGDRYHACKICDMANKYFLTFKESNWADKEANRKNKEFGRKYQAIVPVYVINDPNYDVNNGKFKVLIFNDKKQYQEFRSKIEKQLLKTPVFNGKGAVDLCIHVGETVETFNEGQPNERSFKKRIWDKIVFSTKAYDIPSITKETVESMEFDDTYYISSTPEEILAFYNKYCKISNDDIPEDDEIPVYKHESTPKNTTGSKVMAEVKANNNDVVDDLTSDPDDLGVDDFSSADEPQKKTSSTSLKENDDVDADDLLADLGI